MHLMPRSDPIEKQAFGGTQQELETISSYLEALKKLSTRKPGDAAKDGEKGTGKGGSKGNKDAKKQDGGDGGLGA